MRELNKITKRVVTRYYVNGKGYSSESSALISIGRKIVERLRWDVGYKAFPDAYRIGPEEIAKRRDFERQWMRERYPCVCKSTCYMGGNNGYGCLTARMRDYKQIGEKVVSGELDWKGNPTCTVALPERCA